MFHYMLKAKFATLVSLKKSRRAPSRLTVGVSAAEVAVRGVAVAEAGRAAELVVHVDVEVASLAAVALLPLHVLLAPADARGGVAVRGAVGAALRAALAALAPEGVEVPVVGRALVALLARHPGLARALAVKGALQVLRTFFCRERRKKVFFFTRKRSGRMHTQPILLA